MGELEEIVGYIAKAGVYLIFAFLIIGSVLLFIEGKGDGRSLQEISSPHSAFNTSEISASIISGISKGDPISFISLGLMILIAIPVIWIVTGIIKYALERNKVYTIVSLIVLFDLLFAIFVIPYLVK
ncbi:DUF1634 domain-containing protein [Sulfuracidifex metallicus]|uniref:DUF1634 domain-containing protein n=1 Tax=Sulfuracidifex metallicus DSM 6482 = JCM 9184 TaxID=523847 RepID=A0A6A9QNJ2_SULME|nr:DUF1634 domain-containing protein [Sulfuracidifex metallicus]MUN28845.1 DUF1634 domain-containing protein [Sulfuracidifex metallicus DSM 6482 = JCM 9184]